MQPNPFGTLHRPYILVCVRTDQGESFDIFLTRVPGIGEEVNREDETYRIIRVQHEPIREEGRPPFGWDAFAWAEFVPEAEEEERFKLKKVKRVRRVRRKNSTKRKPTSEQ